MQFLKDYELTKQYLGVFSRLNAPDKVIKEHSVDFVCRGEGEGALIDLCKRMSARQRVDDTPNLWVKEDGTNYKKILMRTFSRHQ